MAANFINTSGNIIANSGNFTTLIVNGSGVSMGGHTHSSSDITNFNSSVSGLLPTIANSANNRILTSTGSSVGINAESNLTFDGTYLVINAFESETSSISFRDYEEGLERLTIRYDDDVDICEIYSATELSILGPASNNIYFFQNGNLLVSNSNGLNIDSGSFGLLGDAQSIIRTVRRATTDATANVVLTINGGAPGASNRLTIPAKTLWTFTIKLSAYNDTDNLGAWWIFRGGIRRNAANGTALISSIIVENGSEGGMSSTSASVVADDTNEALEIRVTGLVGKNIRWVGVLDISQVSY